VSTLTRRRHQPSVVGVSDMKLENKTLKEKVALITGSAQGLGRIIAAEMANEGAKVVLCDVNPETLSPLAGVCYRCRSCPAALTWSGASKDGADAIFPPHREAASASSPHQARNRQRKGEHTPRLLDADQVHYDTI
jgi:NAD(P)-dependent dehydrogenase (short-subunit alcohol dehydrogenase family)